MLIKKDYGIEKLEDIEKDEDFKILNQKMDKNENIYDDM